LCKKRFLYSTGKNSLSQIKIKNINITLTLEDYYCFGKEIISPCDGEIVTLKILIKQRVLTDFLIM